MTTPKTTAPRKRGRKILPPDKRRRNQPYSLSPAEIARAEELADWLETNTSRVVAKAIDEMHAREGERRSKAE